jgi:hypothetical protein
VLGVDREWIGGANVPTIGGMRVNAGMPFARLTLGDGRVELRFRAFAGRLFRAEGLVAGPSELRSVWPIEGTGLRRYLRFRGIGLRNADGHEYYFKTLAADDILRTLESEGFPVTWVVGPAAKIWQGVP